MKIAQITNVFPPYRGGMGQVPWYYANYLHTFGEDVEVITPAFLAEKIQTPYPVHYLKPWFAWGLAALCPHIMQRLKKYDIIQLHYPAYGVALFVVLWQLCVGRRKGKRLFVFYHMDTVARGWLGVLFRVHRLLVLPLLMRAAQTVFVSTRDYAAHSYVQPYIQQMPEKFVALPFGVTAQYTPGEKNTALLQKYTIPIHKKILLFVGGLRREHYFKGMSVLLTACAHVSRDDWHLVCVGKGDMIEHYTDEAQKLGIAQLVTFTGFQPDEVMPDWYRSSYVTILPSIDKSEAFGIVLVEALACGCPTIASDLPGVRTVSALGETGEIVPPGDSDALARVIADLLQDTKKRDEFAQAGVMRAQKMYQWDVIVTQLLSEYRKNV